VTSRKRSFLIILTMTLITAAGVYLIQSVEEPIPTEPEPVPVAVEVATITPRPFTHRLEALGTVEPIREAEVGAQVSGPITFIPPEIELGASVEKGGVLAEIDPTPFSTDVPNSISGGIKVIGPET